MTDPDKRVSVSWSSLRASEECKQKAYLQRSGRKNQAADIRGFFHGTVADRVMRKWLENADRSPGDMARMVDSLIDESIKEAKASGQGVVRWKSPTDRAEMRDYCIELVNRLEPILEKYVLPFDFQAAYWFRVPVQVPWLDGTPTWIDLVGEMDLLTYKDNGELDDGYRVWDLKATQDPQYWRKTIGQLVFYDLATEALFGKNTVEVGLIQPMVEGTPIYGPITVTDDDRAQLWGRIHRYVSDIWLKDYSPKDDSVGCSYCPVKHACQKYKRVTAVGSKGRRKMSLGGGFNV